MRVNKRSRNQKVKKNKKVIKVCHYLVIRLIIDNSFNKWDLKIILTIISINLIY
jgi:hypothetical protein